MAEIILNLAREDRATVFEDPKERLQVDAYQSAFDLLQSAREFADNTGKERNKDKRNYNALNRPLDRIHNTIFIDGPRGSGKTAFMLNLENAYNDNTSGQKDGLYFSQPIDPTLLSIKEDFINVIIGQIHAEIETVKSDDISDAYINALEQVTDALESEFTAKSSYGVDRFLAFKSSLDLERRLFEYFAEAKDLLDCKAIVLLIDDVDMSLDIAFNVLEVIRKYLACPFILPIVSGDKSLYRTIVTRHFVHQLAINARKPVDDEKADAKELADRYIQKLFPRYAEIRLLSFPELLQQHQINIKSASLNISFNRLYHRLRDISFAGTNGIEDSKPTFLPQTCRDLSQFLNGLANIDNTVLTTLCDPDKQDVTATLHRSNNLLDKMANYFAAGDRQDLYQLLKTSIQLFNTADRRDDKALFFRHAGIIDTRNHTAGIVGKRFAEKSTIALEKSGYSERDKASQLPYMKRLPEVMIKFAGIEPYTARLLIAKSRVDRITDPDEQLLLRLYTHNDYYSSYQTGYLVFFGKVFELIISSIYQDLSAKDINQLLAQPPFHSFFHYFPTKLAETEDTDDTSEEDADESLITDEQSKNRLEQFADDINQWRTILGNTEYSGQLLYSVFNKYFSAVKLLKNRSFLAEQSIQQLHKRVYFILLNTIASFENKATDVVKQGIAMSENFNIENSMRGDPSYLKNIKPLLIESDNDSLTKAIAKHPVFELGGLTDFEIKVDKAKKELTKAKLAQQEAETEGSIYRRYRREARVALKNAISSSDLAILPAINKENWMQYVVIIRGVIVNVRDSADMAKYKDEYNRQKNTKSSLFYQIYRVAEFVEATELLDSWLAGKN